MCPLSGAVFSDPVIAPDGKVYERSVAVAYLSSHDGLLPGMTEAVTPEQLFRDQSMRERISAGAMVEDLTDPISMDDLVRPVVASDGRTYEESTFRNLFAQGSGQSPFTREPLARVAYRNRFIEADAAMRDGEWNRPMATGTVVRIDEVAEAGARAADRAGADEDLDAMIERILNLPAISVPDFDVNPAAQNDDAFDRMMEERLGLPVGELEHVSLVDSPPRRELSRSNSESSTRSVGSRMRSWAQRFGASVATAASSTFASMRSAGRRFVRSLRARTSRSRRPSVESRRLRGADAALRRAEALGGRRRP